MPHITRAWLLDMMDLRFRHAQVIAEGFVVGLGLTQFGLGRHRHALEVLQAFDGARVDAGVVPFFAVKGRVVIGVAHDLADALDDQPFAFRRVHGFALREPIAACGIGHIALVVSGREGPGFHDVASRGN
jgi:hypothetical protein